MRTDAKVGLISVFIIILGVVGYFAWQRNRTVTQPTDYQQTGTTGLLQDDSRGRVVSPPTVTPPATDSFGRGALVIPPPTSGPASTTQSLSGGVSVDRAFPPAASAPGATYPAPFGNAGGSASTVTIEAPGTRRAIDFGNTPGGSVAGPGNSGGAPVPSGNTYAVKKGDTFKIIAKALKTSVASLEAANPGVSSNHLKIGQQLNIPADAGSTPAPVPAPSASSSGSAASSGGDSAAPATRSARSSDSGSTASGKHPSTYVVKKGDTLVKIAKKFYGEEKAWQRIVRANRDVLNRDGSNLDIGMELKLPD